MDNHATIQGISASGNPAPVGPYSPAIAAGGLIWISGQIALEPAGGALIGATAAEQAEIALGHLGRLLEAAGSGFDRVVRTTLYLVDMGDFAAVNEVYARFFVAQPFPARSTVAVAALPKGARFEIDAVALPS